MKALPGTPIRTASGERGFIRSINEDGTAEIQIYDDLNGDRLEVVLISSLKGETK